MGVHDLRSHQLVHRLSLAADGPLAVPAIVHHADDPHSLYAAAGACVHQLDLRQVPAARHACLQTCSRRSKPAILKAFICSHALLSLHHPFRRTLMRPHGSTISVLRKQGIRSKCGAMVQGAVLQRYQFNSDEVNGLALSASRQFLAAADDAGEVAVIDVRARALHKALRGAHDNIASGARPRCAGKRCP